MTKSLEDPTDMHRIIGNQAMTKSLENPTDMHRIIGNQVPSRVDRSYPGSTVGIQGWKIYIQGWQ